MSTQISFSIRVSSGVNSVHVVGSWDTYTSQLPLSRDKASSSGKTWRGTFRFGARSVNPGQRYWYYFIVDGYHCAVNPSVESIIEPTTGRELNILIVPDEKKTSSSSSGSSGSKSKSSSSSSHHSSSHSSSHHSSSKHSSSSSSKHSSSRDHKDREYNDRDYRDRDRDHHRERRPANLTVDIPKGRPLSVSQIKSPKPITPIMSTHILRYDEDEIDALAAQFGGTVMIDAEGIVSGIHMGSPASSSTGSTGSSYYRSDSSSPDNSGSGYSTPGSGSDYAVCRCDNYGITRRGDRIKIDCGGQVCGYSDSDGTDSDCSGGRSEAGSPVHRRGVVFR